MSNSSCESDVSGEPGLPEFIKVLAYHEAGHAVLAWHLNVPLKKLVIEKSGGVCLNSMSVSPLVDPEFMSERDWRQVKARALILLGGEMAELVCSEMADLAGDDATADLFRCAYTTSCESTLPGSDREELKELVQLILGSPGYKATHWVRELECRAQEIVIEHWDRVCALADALIEKRVLSGVEAARTIRDAQIRDCRATAELA